MLRTVTLPALAPGIVSAASVVFLFCATSFGVVLTLGGLRYATVETEIYLLTTQFLDLQAAAALSLLQLARRRRAAVRRAADPGGPRAGARPGGGARHDATGRGRRDAGVVAVTVAVLLFVAAPLATLVLRSLRVDGRWGLGHYRDLVTTGDAARCSCRRRPRWRTPGGSPSTPPCWRCCSACWSRWSCPGARGRAASGAACRCSTRLFMLPLGVSAVTLGFGFLITLDRPPLDLRSSPVLVPIAQAMVALPLVVRTLVPVLRSIEPRQRQAAASLGASPVRVRSPSTCRCCGGRCSPRPGSRSRSRSASSGRPASWPARTGRRCRW